MNLSSPNCRLSIITLNFNRLEETRSTIEKLLLLTAERDDIEIVAVDNNSTDGTADYLAERDGITAILLESNDGIAGYQEGFIRANGEYLLVLDDDSCPADESTLTNLISTLDQRPDIGIIACHIETVDGKPQWKWHLPHSMQFDVSPFFIGCGFGIRRNLFKKIGWYPGDFFIYQNEIDVSFKIRQEGYEIYYHPECRVIHRGSPGQRPGQRRIYYPTRNTIWLIRKYYPQPMAAYMIVSRLMIGFIRSIYFGQFRTFIQAMRDGFSTPIAKRTLSKEIQKVSLPFWRQNSIIHQLLKWS